MHFMKYMVVLGDYQALQFSVYIWGVYLGHYIHDILGTHTEQSWESVSVCQYWIDDYLSRPSVEMSADICLCAAPTVLSQ